MYKVIITTLTLVNGDPLPAQTHDVTDPDWNLKQCQVYAVNISNKMEIELDGERVVVIQRGRCSSTMPVTRKLEW